MMENEFTYYETPSVTLAQHTRKTFLWMFLGLMVTALVAFGMAKTGLMLTLLVKVPLLSIIILIAQIGVAIAFGARLMKMKPVTATILYFVYAVLLGTSLSSLMYVYELGTIFVAFGLTAIYFAALAIIGYTTSLDLTKLGMICGIGLIILVIAEIILMFVGVDTTTKVFTAIGMIIFTGLTAYDVQKIKTLYATSLADPQTLSKLSIYSAFELYLDFINIFLYILRLVGSRD